MNPEPQQPPLLGELPSLPESAAASAQSNAVSEHEPTHELLVPPQLLTQLVYCDAQPEPGATQFSSPATQVLSQV